MGKAFPDDVPLEAKMVTRAIERAQRTVEDRNFEIRKDVLKYDEVMNEQRKVIYRRRQQILDGEDLRDEAFDTIGPTVDGTVLANCIERIHRGVGPRRVHNQLTSSTRADHSGQLDDCSHRNASSSCFIDDAMSCTRRRR